ncbi:MAG: hypothetical protein AAF721_18425, partial [Myxococcota bacterium]
AEVATLAVAGISLDESIAVSPGGDAVVGLTAEAELLMWGGASPRTVVAAAYGDVRFSADGRWLVARTDPNTLHAWRTDDASSAEPPRVYENVSHFELAPSGDLVAVVASSVPSKGLIVHDLLGGTEARLATEGLASDIRFSQDASTVSAFDGSTPHIWDIDSGAHMRPRWPKEIIGVQLDGEGKRAFTLDRAGARVTWPLPWGGQRVAPRGKDGQEGGLLLESLSANYLSYRGDVLFAAAGSAILRLAREADRPTTFATMSDDVRRLQSAGHTLAAYDGRQIVLWEGDEETLREPIEPGVHLRIGIVDRVVTAMREDTVQQTDLRTGKTVTVVELEKRSPFSFRLSSAGGLTLLARDEQPLLWWKDASPDHVESFESAGTSHRAGGDGQSLLLVRGSDGRATVRALDGSVRATVDGFAPIGLRLLSDGALLGTTHADETAIWQPGMTAPAVVAGPYPSRLWGPPLVSADGRELAIAPIRGSVIRTPIPSMLWVDEPAETLAGLQPRITTDASGVP